MIDCLVLVIAGYILGSVPFGVIVGRVFKRIDIRDLGSGNTGMTNVLRTVGVAAAVLVLALDMGKAIVTVSMAKLLFDSAGAEVAAALAVLLGHIWPIFTRFRGGKGTATGCGGLLVLSPMSWLVALAIGVPLIGITRYMSLASILGAVGGAFSLIIFSATGHAPTEYIWFGAIGATLVLVRHKDNLRRLLRGEEPKIGQAGQIRNT